MSTQDINASLGRKSWRDCLGHNKCDEIECRVDEFLLKYPSWETYESKALKDYQHCVNEGICDTVGVPMVDYYRGSAMEAWASAIRDLGESDNDDYAIYALRYANNEWTMVEKKTILSYIKWIGWKARQTYESIQHKVQKKPTHDSTKQFADFNF